MITTIPDRERDLQAQVDALTEELASVEASNRIRGDELVRLRDEMSKMQQHAAPPADIISRAVANAKYWMDRAEHAEAELERLRAQEPVALKSVHLIRDVHGMCAVLVNGRMAIRDNGDIIDHFATLDWFAAPPAQPAEPAQRLSDDDIDRTLATTLDALAKLYGIDHAMHVRTDIAEHHTLRRAFARAIESALQTKATK